MHVHADASASSRSSSTSSRTRSNTTTRVGRVTITATTTDPGARVAIADTGIGIDPWHMRLLFEPFERLGAEGTAIEGTGLGLALSKGLVELMGGAISASSEPGRGSEFIIDLLAAESPHGRPLSTVPDRLSATGPERTTTRARALYIDDNDSNLRLMDRILTRHRRWSVDLLIAMQGSLGLDLARQHTPQVILLDLHLPDIPGEDVLRHLKADPVTAEIPVVILTAEATPGLESRLKQLGAAEFLTKPLDVRRLIDTISEWLDKASERPD